MFRLYLFIAFSLLASPLYSQSPKYEFRGVWIASVSNIDWPSKPGLDPEAQRKEYIQLLDLHKSHGINAVVVQVRPCADAFYPSPLEPWSKWLTGKSGKGPGYDPLAFMIEEAHRRGMEFHAWFNPYRALINAKENMTDSASVAFQHPEWMLPYGKNLYFDPGIPEARQHTVNVTLDVVNRYGVDGIHFDDYFYPYRIAKENFPDSASFVKYGKGFSTVEDWRRHNVDALIHKISDSLRSVKPHVKFGISPFGVWRNHDKDPKGSLTHAGQTCYDDLYADVLKWAREGWIDYLVPQLYWSIGFKPAPYETLLKWWNENNYGKTLIIGQGVYRVGGNGTTDEHWKKPKQMPRQLKLNRKTNHVSGSIFFSAKTFKSNPQGITDYLRTQFYAQPALVPPMVPTKTGKPTSDYALSFTPMEKGTKISWEETLKENQLSAHARYVVYRFKKNSKMDLTKPSSIAAILPNTNPSDPTQQSFIDLKARKGKRYQYAVTFIDPYNLESIPQTLYRTP